MSALPGVAHADQLFWDANGETAGTGGAGTWDKTSSLWRNGSATGPLQAWADGNEAVFGGTAGTVTINPSDASVTPSQITYQTAAYIVASAAGKTLALSTPTVVDTSTFAETFTAVISGGSLTKAGTSTLTLSGANTYAGPTTINAGVISANQNVGAANSSVVVNSAGTLNFSGGTTTNSISGNGAVTNSNVTTVTGDNSAFAGTWTANNQFSINAPNSTSANAAYVNNFANNTNGFIFGATGTYNLGSISGVAGSTFRGGNATTLGAINLIIGNRNSNTAFAGNIINNTGGTATAVVSLTKIGSGTQTLSGTLSYTGATTVSSGNLNIAGTKTLVGPVTVAGGTTNATQGTLDLRDGAVGTLTLSNAAGLTVGSATDPSVLAFDIGGAGITPSSDRIAVTNAFNVNSGGAVVRLNSLGNVTSGQSYTLMTYNNANAPTNLSLDPAFASSISPLTATLVVTNTTLSVTIGGLQNFYWTGALSNIWSSIDGGNTNFATEPSGSTNTGVLPSNTSDVFFTANSATNLNSVLGQDFTIKSLTFTGDGTSAGTNPVNIGGSNALTLNTGITVLPGNAGSTISTTGGLPLIANQIWTNNAATPLIVSSNVSGANFGVTKAGTGALTLSGSNTYTGTTTAQAGTTNLPGSITASNAAGGIAISPISGATAAMNINGGSVLVGGNLAGNASITVGNVTGGTGILNMSGGTVTTGGTATSREIHVGRAGAGVANISGGTTSIGGFLVGGIATAGASGIWNISGGSVSVLNTQNFGATLGATAATTGVMNLTGNGSFSSTSAGGLGGIFVGENGTGILNVSGSGTATLGGAAASTGLSIGQGNAAAVNGIVNLGAVGTGGGTITTTRVQKAGAAATGTFNFHGGTLRGSSVTPNAAFMTGLTNAFVYGEGAVVDTNNQSLTIGQALLAPTGSGVSAISTAGLTTAGFTATPLVTITGGSGTGATAVATIDGMGTLTGITVTNPGSGYTVGDTLTVTLSGGGFATPSSSTSAVTLALNVSGGLTKNNVGTLTLNGASTYSGATTVNAGTLTINGSTTSATTVNTGSTLSGTGSVGGITVNSGGTSAPGSATTGAATSTQTINGNFTLSSGSTMRLVSPLNQASVVGAVNLAGSNLVVASSATTTATSFVIINNDLGDPVSGVFANLPQGALVSDGSGTTYTISYTGGDGNDVQLVRTPASGGVIINEFRVSGPSGELDEFIEIYNTTNSSVNLTNWTVTSNGALAATIPEGKAIPPYARLLLTGNTYSLTSYAGSDAALSGDVTSAGPLELRNTAGTTVDTVTPAALAAPTSPGSNYSYVRRMDGSGGAPLDSDSPSDFNTVDVASLLGPNTTTGVSGNVQRLGAPGPQNLSSPTVFNSLISFVAAAVPSVRVGSGNSGTLALRNVITNRAGSGRTITGLRFRVVALTAGTSNPANPSGGPFSGPADVRLISSSSSDGTLLPLLLQEPPAQPNGGGLNSSVSLASLPGGGLAPGQAVTVEFLFNVIQRGNYRYLVNCEPVTAATP